jgi:hypothetical protein
LFGEHPKTCKETRRGHDAAQAADQIAHMRRTAEGTEVGEANQRGVERIDLEGFCRHHIGKRLYARGHPALFKQLCQ